MMKSKARSKAGRIDKNHIDYPHLTEEIWQNISSHLSTREWAKAAGTCKTTHTMSLKWARLGQDIPLEGRYSVSFSSQVCD